VLAGVVISQDLLAEMHKLKSMQQMQTKTVAAILAIRVINQPIRAAVAIECLKS
jgi:hypothetical protein